MGTAGDRGVRAGRALPGRRDYTTGGSASNLQEGKRLGIVGLGNIGKKVARRVRGFDMDVRYFDILHRSGYGKTAVP